MLTAEQKQSYNELLYAIVESLDITKTQFNNLQRSYNDVGTFLKEDDVLKLYHPIVSPQGSLRLGTIIQPVFEDDDLDVDLVFRLTSKNPSWTQFLLKYAVGNRLKSSNRYSPMLDKEGHRCWTLKYRDNADSPKERYHMDILPCVADSEYESRLQRMMANVYQHDQIDKLSIRITDNNAEGYYTETDIDKWLKSNPDGYALWFANRCKLNSQISMRSLNDIIPIGRQSNKTILQRIVQLLKRHRDYMFRDDKDNKPISIIITTLAARAYRGENNLLEGFCNVVNSMTLVKKGDLYWVENPVNPDENFADKWKKYPQRQVNFIKWLQKIKSDVSRIFTMQGIPLQREIADLFGEKIKNDAYSRMGENLKKRSADGTLKVGSTAMLGSVGRTLNAANTFYGKK